MLCTRRLETFSKLRLHFHPMCGETAMKIKHMRSAFHSKTRPELFCLTPCRMSADGNHIQALLSQYHKHP